MTGRMDTLKREKEESVLPWKPKEKRFPVKCWSGLG
jgi:hypothetical protein